MNTRNTNFTSVPMYMIEGGYWGIYSKALVCSPLTIYEKNAALSFSSEVESSMSVRSIAVIGLGSPNVLMCRARSV